MERLLFRFEIRRLVSYLYASRIERSHGDLHDYEQSIKEKTAVLHNRADVVAFVSHIPCL